jgi:predicted RNase H-like HicB family nuclease
MVRTSFVGAMAGEVEFDSMNIRWSDEDRLFLVTIPEFAELVVMLCTHGKTRDEAIRSGEEVIEMYLADWQAEGESIPEPRTLQIA